MTLSTTHGIEAVTLAHSQQKLAEIVHVAAHPEEYAVHSAVCEEAMSLILERRANVEFVDVPDPHALSAGEQHVIDRYISELESAANGAERFVQPPAMGPWSRLRKRAHALQPLYTPDATTLGGPIHAEVYNAPLFRIVVEEGGVTAIRLMSAAEILRTQYQSKGNVAKGEQIIRDHEEFVGQPIDYLSELFYRGSKDAQGIRARAHTAISMATRQFVGEVSKQDLRCASFACGAAGPVSLLVSSLEGLGVHVEKTYFIDSDPMALAGAYATADEAGLTQDSSVVELLLRDLLKDDLSRDIQPGSLDVADLLGIVEYLPDDFAVALLAQAKKLMRPGGVIIWANMLNSRPQQQMFKNVVKWPPLKQRSISQCLDIMERAGFDLDNVDIAISARDGVYANYAMKIPESEPSATNQKRIAHIPLLAA